MKASSKTDTKVEQKARVRTWWRWPRRILVALLVLALLLRVAIHVAIPYVAEAVCKSIGLRVEFEAIRLSLLSLRVELEDVALYASNAKESDPPLLRVEWGDVQFDLGALLNDGVIRFPTAELDGVDLEFGLETDRMITLWDRVAEYGRETANGEGTESVKVDELVEDAEHRLDLTLPVEIGSVRIQHLRLLFKDHRPGQEWDAKILCYLRGKDLGSRAENNHLFLSAASPNLIEAFRLEVDGIAGPGILRADVSLHLAEFEPARVETYLRQMGIWPEAKDVAMELQATVDLEPRNDKDLGSSGVIAVQELMLFMDGEQSLDLGKFEADVALWSSERLHVDRMSLHGIRSRAEVLEDGNLSVAGIALLGGSSRKEDGPKDKREEGPSDRDKKGMGILLDSIQIRDLRLAFRDEANGVDQEAQVQTISISNLCLGDVDPLPTVDLEASLALPGSVESWTLSASFETLGEVRELHLASRMNGLTLKKLSPYLVAAGFKPELVQGELSFAAKARIEDLTEGGTRVDLSLDGMKLKDGKDLLVLDKVEARNWVHEGRSGAQSLQLLEVSGLGMEVRRDEEDRIYLLGMLVLPAADTPAPSSIESGATNKTKEARDDSKDGNPIPASAEGPSQFSLERLLAHNSWLHLQDRSKRARLQEIHGLWSVDVRHVELGKATASMRPMEFDVRLSIREVLDRLEIKGRLEMDEGGRDLTMDLEGKGIQGANLKPFLEAVGISPEFDSADLSMRLDVEGLGQSGHMPKKIELSGLRFNDSERTLFELDSLQVQGVSSNDSGTQIDEVVIDTPVLRVERDSEGVLHLAGFVLHGAEVAKEDEESGSASVKTKGRSEESQEGKPRDAKGAIPPTKNSGPTFLMKSLDLRKAHLDLVDRFLETKNEIPIDIDLKLESLSVGGDASSVTWDLSLSVPENIERLRVHGVFSQKQGLALRLGLQARGIQKGSLDAYMPEGVSIDMEKGELEGKVDINLAVEDDGSRSISASLEGFSLSDGDEKLWRLDKVVLQAARKGSENEVYRVEELSTEGHEIWIARDSEKRLHVLGLALEPSIEADPVREDAEALAARLEDKKRKRIDRFRALRAPLEKFASVHLGKLSIGIDQIHFLDELRPDSKSVVGALKIFNPKPMDLLPSDTEDLPPAEVHIEASLLPIFRNLKLKLIAEPWSIIPELSASLLVEGLRGEGLTEVFPGLLEKIHGRALPDGLLKVDLRLALQLRRTSRMSFPLENGFGLNFDLDGFELRDKPDGRILLGLDSLEIQMRRFEPRTGNLWIRSISAEMPRARIDRTEDGFVVGGICIRMPKTEYPEGEEPAEVETVTSSSLTQTKSPAGSKAASPEGTDSKDPVMRVDTATISGIDVEFKDLRAKPPTLLPIKGLEAELKNLARGPSRNRRPMSFQVYLDGGLIDLPKRPESKGLIRGLVSGASSIVVSPDSSIPMEKRPIFDELSFKGAFRLSPSLRGQAKLDLTSFELLAFQSLAKRFGVLIQDGVLDLGSTVGIGADDQIQVSIYPVFTFLSLSEPKDGFLSDLLALPAPLDTTLFLTKNSYGEHVYPFSFSMEKGQISGHQVRSIVISALSRSLATMVTSSPFRLLGGVTSIVGIDINTRNTEVGEPIQLAFDPGHVKLNEKQRKQVQFLVAALKEDVNIDLRIAQRSGLDDWAYSDRIANPPKEHCRALARGLLQKKRELERERSRLATKLLSLYENGRIEDARKWSADLRHLDRELGDLEISMEEIFGHLRPGADRQRDRRTKVATMEIAQRRIENVRKELIRVGGESFRDRLHTIRPRTRKDESLQKGEVILVQRRRVGR